MEDWKAKDRRHVWHPYTPDPSPLNGRLLTGASGAYVWEESGHRVLDLTASWWCNIHGHCHPRLVRALSEQAARLDQVMFSPHTHSGAIELATKLSAKLGRGLERVFYSDDGSTAVEAALKLAVQYWHNRGVRSRNRFLALKHAYHGDTMGAVSVSHVEQFHHYFSGLLWPTERVEAPHPYGDPHRRPVAELEADCLARARQGLERHGSELAALIVEPLIQGAGGMRTYSPAFLDALVELAREHGLLIIFDEVFTGFGRTGTFFAFHQCRHTPDIVCLSKGLTSGMLPLAATVVTEGVYDAFRGGPEKAFYHGHTFTANAPAVAVALESLALLEEPGQAEHRARLQRCFEEAVPRFAGLPQVGEVRHLGMIFVLDLVADPETGALWSPANGPGWRVAERLWEQGFWLRPLNQLLYLVPPYCVGESELKAALDVLYSELARGENFAGFPLRRPAQASE